MSCLTFGLLGPFLLIYREGIDLSENGMFRDIFLFNQEIEELSQETENLVSEIDKWQM